MLTVRMWDCELSRENLELINSDNPYRENTLEYHLINYIVENIEAINKNTTSSIHNLALLKVLKEKKINVDLHPWNYHDLFGHALSLARMAYLVRIVKKQDSPTPSKKFGVFLESGMLDILKNENYIQFLKNAQIPYERKLALWQVLYIASQMHSSIKLPVLNFKNTSAGSSIEINNFRQDWFRQIHNLPIGSWSFPYPSEDWTKVTSRGLFHHIGDEWAFFIAAIQYGECYVLGHDEMGDLIVLGSVSSASYRYANYTRVSASDFDYIYSTPKGEGLFSSKKTMFSDDKNDCKVNHAKNSVLGDAYWLNDTFLKHAQRHVELLSYQEFLEKFRSGNEAVLQRYPAQQALFEKLKSGSFFDNQKLADILKDLMVFEFLDEWQKPKEDQPESAEQYFDESASRQFRKITYQQMEHYQINAVITENIRNCEWHYKNHHAESSEFYEKLKEQVEVLLNRWTYPAYERSVALTTYKSLLQEALALMEKEMVQARELHILHDSAFVRDMIVENSYFYKTVVHKVHCEVLNPKPDSKLGFFLKNDGKSEPEKLYIHYQDAIFEYLKQTTTELFDDYFEKYFFNKLSQNADRHTYSLLLSYWKELDNKAFVLSETVDMQNEYRMFVINHRVVATTPCYRNSTPFDAWENGRFDPRLCDGHSATNTFYSKESRQRVTQYARFARMFCKEIKQTSPDTANYVLDVAWSNELGCVIPIEINSVTWSGAYQLNMHRLCAAVAGVPYNSDVTQTGYYNMKEMKETSWAAMLTEGIRAEDDKMPINGKKISQSGHAEVEKLNEIIHETEELLPKEYFQELPQLDFQLEKIIEDIDRLRDNEEH